MTTILHHSRYYIGNVIATIMARKEGREFCYWPRFTPSDVDRLRYMI